MRFQVPDEGIVFGVQCPYPNCSALLGNRDKFIAHVRAHPDPGPQACTCTETRDPVCPRGLIVGDHPSAKSAQVSSGPVETPETSTRTYRHEALVTVADAVMGVLADLDTHMNLSPVEIALGVQEAMLRCVSEKNRPSE